METKKIKELEEFIAQYPVFEYRMLDTEELTFADRVRWICQNECQRYDTTWACPPAVGSLEECMIRCREYPQGFFFSTVAEVGDILDMKELLGTRREHEKITQSIGEYLMEEGYDCYILSTESCAICQECTYPQAPCRHPDKMHPCLESHGVVVSQIVEDQGMTYSLGGNTVLWFSMVLLREQMA